MRPQSERAWIAFRQRVAELGGEVLESSWLGSGKGHEVRCREGHTCHPSPSNLQIGRQGLCRICAGQYPGRAEAAFRATVADRGGEVLEVSWKGSHTPHLVRCSEGHVVSPRPSDVSQGKWCRACAGKDPSHTSAMFRARVEELGGTVIEPTWLGSTEPNRVLCSNGHQSAPMPTNVLRGQGICKMCAWSAQDVVYVVVNSTTNVVKLGITSGDPKSRTGNHKRDGFTDVVAVRQGLPEGVAYATEQATLRKLAEYGHDPVRGREYFPAELTSLILDLIESQL